MNTKIRVTPEYLKVIDTGGEFVEFTMGIRVAWRLQ